MQIAYTAITETCTLLLDAGGICRSVITASARAVGNGPSGRTARIPASAEKCIGAQYVATIDVREPGGMVPLPKEGAQMLFARTESNGRITLVRSAPVVRFEAAPPDTESGVRSRPDDSSGTTLPGSAPHARVAYGDDEEPTIQQSPERRSSLPPPPRNSGVVPVGNRVGRTAIPPPPAMPRVTAPDSETRPIVAARIPSPPSLPHVPSVAPPRRPSVIRVSAPEWELETRPFKRARR
jgi:hypothetical protein